MANSSFCLIRLKFDRNSDILGGKFVCFHGKNFFLCLLFLFSFSLPGMCSGKNQFKQIPTMQLMAKLNADLIQVQSNNKIALQELTECKVELTKCKEELNLVKTNSGQTIQLLANANQQLENYKRENEAKIRKLKWQRNLWITGFVAALAVAIKK